MVGPKRAMDQHVAILGKTGSGKSYAAKGLVEWMLEERRQVCVLDPTGAWWGLRLAADGKRAGFPVVLIGGDRGDVPLSARSGEAVARLVTEQRASVVIDTSGLTVADYTRWFIDFAGSVYSGVRSPLQLVIDEAHHFAPQGKVPDPDTGRMLHAANRLMSGGRSRGIRAMLITQRPAKLHKDSLSCADTLIAMRVIAPQDRDAIRDWVEGSDDRGACKAVMESLASLKRGEGWFWYPEGNFLERVTFPKIKTYDSSATPTGDGGSKPSIDEINLDAVRSALADAVKEAEANDPKALKRRIAELEKQVGCPTMDQSVIDRACAARDEHWRRVVSTQHGRLMSVQDRLRAIILAAEQAADFARTNARELNAAEVVGTNQGFRRAQHPGAQQPAKNHGLTRVAAATVEAQRRGTGPTASGHSRDAMTSPVAGNAGGNIGKGERITLIAIAQHPAGVTREQLTILTGYKRSSRDAYLQRLRASEYVAIAVNEGTIVATESGIAALGNDYEPLPTGDRLREYWMQRLSGGERVIFEVVCRAYPHAIKRTDIDQQTEYQRSSRDAYLQRLTARRLILNGRDGVKASEELFG